MGTKSSHSVPYLGRVLPLEVRILSTGRMAHREVIVHPQSGQSERSQIFFQQVTVMRYRLLSFLRLLRKIQFERDDVDALRVLSVHRSVYRSVGRK
jgi:hypothetical protein